MSTCNNCGAALSPDQNKCTYCGTAAPPRSPAAPTVPAAHAHSAAPPPASAVPVAGEPKSKLAAGLLGIFLGSFGIHNFYLGYTGKGVAQLLITICTCFYGSLITGIWGLVEGIMILTGSINKDARGVPLRD